MASLSFSVTGVQDLKRLQAFLDPKLYDKAKRGGITYASPHCAASNIRGARDMVT